MDDSIQEDEMHPMHAEPSLGPYARKYIANYLRSRLAGRYGTSGLISP